MTGKDIIISGLQDFDIAIGSNCVNLANEFAKDNRVLYVNFPVDRISKYRYKNHPLIHKRIQVQNKTKQGLVKIHDNLWSFTPSCTIESISKIGPNWLFDFFNKNNNKIFAKEIKTVIDNLDFKDFVFFQDSDIYRSFYLKDLLKPSLYIYYTRDNLIHTDYYRKHGERIESMHMAKADIVVANSTYLANYARKSNPNSFYVGQGCDISLFDKDKIKKIPDDLSNIKKPIIGYIGALKSIRLDIETLIYIGEQKPEWSIVLVGPEDEQFKSSKLHEMHNVYFLGSKDMLELPSYLAGFDVALNPQKLNELTIGNYPRKIDEYLAMGKPTMATLTQTMEVFKNYVYLAKNNEEYVSLIDKALRENNSSLEQDRITFAKTHTWENNIKEIYKAIDSI